VNDSAPEANASSLSVSEASPLSRAEAWGAKYSVVHSAGVLAVLAGALLTGELRWLGPLGAVSLLVYLIYGERGAARGRRYHSANLVTLLRLLLVVFLGAYLQPGVVAALLTLGILLLDGVDGWLARRSGAASDHGARFDMETDALLVLVAGTVIYRGEVLGAWILAPGLMRYVYVLAMATGAFREAPPSRIGRAVFTVVAGSLVLSLWPLDPIQAPFAVLACLLLTYSFARSVRWSVS